MEILLFDFSAATVEPPTSSQVRFDAAAYADVSKVWCRNLTTHGMDAHELLARLPLHSTIYVQDKNDHTVFARFGLLAAPVDKIDYVEWPVVLFDSGGAGLFNNQAVIVMVAIPADVNPAPAPTPGGAARLITPAMAKWHLERPDVADDDPKLLQQMAAAEAAILAYITTTDYWAGVAAAWTDPTTVPADVQHTILLLLAHFWRDRGDAADGDLAEWDPNSDMPKVIVRLLRRWRDPALV